MICPIRQQQWIDKKGFANHQTLECVKTKCAWWDKVNKRCGVLSLISTLAKIEDRMPHEAQFRR